jgi:glycosyltransferase involved in cell wall biosynthesis
LAALLQAFAPMKKKKILWLVSWYPNRTDPFDGDFIQRHAQAAAVLHEVHVVFVRGDELFDEVQTDLSQNGSLTEERIYFEGGKGWLNKIVKHIRWKRLFLKAVNAYVLHNGQPDAVHVHIPWKAGLIALYLKRKFGWSYIVSEHWGIYNRIAQGNIFEQPYFVKRTIRKVIQNAEALTSVSHFLGVGITDLICKKTFSVLPNVVDTKLFYPSPGQAGSFRFLHVSNMVPLKNVRGILEAFKVFHQLKPESELVMIGNRDAVWPDFAKEHDLMKGVTFKGELPYAEVAEEMRRAHCLVLNSDIENAPCVVSEALCCGLPVIATTVGGLPEMINERNGLLIQPNANLSLLTAMKQMYEDWRSLDRTRIAADAEALYGFEAIAQQFAQLYEQYGAIHSSQ